jgi:hypothetical protein
MSRPRSGQIRRRLALLAEDDAIDDPSIADQVRAV